MIKKNLTLLTLLVCLCGPLQVSAAQLLDRIIAVVGEDAVMLSELRDRARIMFTELRRSGTVPMPTQKQIIERSLDELILEKLQLAEAKRLGIEADQDTIADAINRVAAENGLTVPQLRDALANEGMDFGRFQDKIRDQLITRRLINREVTNRIQVSRSEVDQQLARMAANAKQRKQVRLSQILITTPDGATPAQIKAAADVAQQAIARIKKGEDFAKIAQDVSSGPLAINGGDLGWLELTNLPPELGQVIDQMQVGELLGPARSPEGFHIFKLQDVKTLDQPQQLVQQTDVRHILIRTDELTSDSDAQSRLNQLRERADQGDDFGNLARSSSDDQASAIKGGELGWVSPGKMVPEFEQAMDNTPIGAISKPFKTRFGWHILQVKGRRDFDETGKAARAEAQAAVRDRKAEEATQQYLRRLRDEAYVDIRLDEVE